MSHDTQNLGPPAQPRSAFPWIIGAILAGGAAFLIFTSIGGGQYAVADFGGIVSAPGDYRGERMRVVGEIKAGSTEERIVDGRPELRFTIVDEHGAELRVSYAKSRPDPYQEGRQCIVEGELDAQDVLVAATLTVKCPSKYQSEDGLVDRTPEYYQEKYGTPPPQGGPRS